MYSIDIIVQNYFSLIRTPFLTESMLILSRLFDLLAYSVTVALFMVFLVYLVRGFRYAMLFLITISSTGILVYLLKLFFNVNRPTDTVISTFGQSFPSYHATIATVFFVMLIYIFDDYFKSFQRIIFNTICILAIFAIAFSRVYLGVHWTSDVIFGIILGSTISYISIIIFRHVRNMHNNTSMLK